MDGRKQFLYAVLVCASEIQVVIQDGTLSVRVFQKSLDLRADVRIECIVGTELHDVIGLHRGVDEALQRTWRLFVEHVMGIVPFIEESQRHGRLDIVAHPQETGIHMVGVQEIRDAPSHFIVSSSPTKTAGMPARPMEIILLNDEPPGTTAVGCAP